MKCDIKFNTGVYSRVWAKSRYLDICYITLIVEKASLYFKETRENTILSLKQHVL